MGRRKNDENPVSLFAFQDIITSITGIMVLVVLLIILDIISHEDTKSPQTPSPFKEDVQKLEATQKELQEKLDKDKEWLTKNEELIVKALSVDLASLPQMIEKERQHNLRLQTALDNMKNENIRLESMILKTKDDVRKNTIKIKTADETITAVKKTIESGDVTIRDLDEKLKKLQDEEEKRKNQVEIRTANDLKLSPVFVECSESEIRTKVISSAKLEEFKNEKKDQQQLLKEFYAWLKKTRDPAKECIVIIVKPSSAEFAATMVAILRQEGFSYNMEPMEEDKTGVYE